MARTQKSVLRKRLRLIATVLLTGGAGSGSWILHDHPVAQKLLAVVQEGLNDDGDDGPSKSPAREGLTNLTSRIDGDKRPGIFQVRVADVRLDEAAFSNGQSLDIQVRVVGFDDRDKASVLWDSSKFGQRLAVVGRDPLTASWNNRPFEVAWKPGDRITVEVWDRGGLLARQRFEMEPPSSDDRFPLRSGTRRLDPVSGRRRPGTSSSSKIAFESKRVGADSETSKPERVADRDKDRSRSTR